MIEAYQVTKDIKLSDARAQLGLTQKLLSELSGISTNVISNSENGVPIRRLSAHALLKAINRKRAEEGLAPLEFGMMDWKIQGE